MAGFTSKEIEHAREMDLLTYLRQNDPGNLIHISGGEYCTREHDSLKISNGKWMWWSRGFGGVSALDYLIKVKNVPFKEAVGMILGTEAKQPPFSFVPKDGKAKRLLLPEKAQDNHVVLRYLTGRAILPAGSSTGKFSKSASPEGCFMSHYLLTVQFFWVSMRTKKRDTPSSGEPEKTGSWVRLQAPTSTFPSGLKARENVFISLKVLSTFCLMPQSGR